MMCALLEDDVLRWMRQTGVPPALLKREAVRDFCSLPGLRKVFEFLLSRAPPKKEKEKIEQAILTHEQEQKARLAEKKLLPGQQRAQLREELNQLTKRCRDLRQILDRQKGQLQTKIGDTVQWECDRERLHGDLEGLALQAVALSHYKDWCADLVPQLGHYINQVQMLIHKARLRCAALTASEKTKPGAGSDLSEKVSSLTNAIHRELQKGLGIDNKNPSRRGVHVPDKEGPGGLNEVDYDTSFMAGTPELPTYMPSEEVMALLKALEDIPPMKIIQKLSYEAELTVKSMKDRMDKLDLVADAVALRARLGPSLGPDAEEHQALDMLNPIELLKQRQRRHLNDFIKTEATDAAARAASYRLDNMAVEDAGRRLYTHPGVRAEMELEGLKAEVLLLEDEMTKLGEEMDSRAGIEQVLYAKRTQIHQLLLREKHSTELMTRLIYHNTTLSSSWDHHRQAFETYVGQELKGCCENVVAACKQGKGFMEKEAKEFLQVNPDSIITGTQANAEAGGVQSGAALPPLLKRLRLARTAQPSAAVLTLEEATLGSGPFMAPPADAAMRTLMGCAPLVDVLLPLMCPERILQAVEGSRAHREALHSSVEQLRDVRETMKSNLDKMRRVGSLLEEENTQQMEEAINQWVPELEKAHSQGREAKRLAEERVKIALEEWRDMPAQHAVPHHTVDGQNLASWLSEYHDLLSQIKEGKHLLGQSWGTTS